MTLDLRPFKTLITERCGLMIEGNSEHTLVRSLEARVKALTIRSAEYYALLCHSEAEFQELVNLLTINETYFFREPEQINLLVHRLAPRFLAARNGTAPVRILSAGCSSGEEPYSLVMALTDKYGESVSRLFSFAGGDIDSNVLAKARNARYGEFSFRGVATELRSRYFDKEISGYALKTQVKNQVSFHELNLLASSFTLALQGFDIIFFRNVSIYFDPPTRKIIQQNLASLLNDDGILVIGTAETLANDLGILPLVEEDGLFYFAKGSPPLPDVFSPKEASEKRVAPKPHPPAPALPLVAVAHQLNPLQVAPGDWVVPATAPTTVAVVIPVVPLSIDLGMAHQMTRDKRYDEALSHLKVVLDQEPGNIEARLLTAHISINRRDFFAAEALAHQVLATDNWSIDALLLLGLASKWRQQSEAAIRWFKQAVYARHECWPAHYYLGDLYRHSGEIELARRAYRVAISLLSQGESDTGIKVIPLGLLASEIRFLCEHQMAKLPEPKRSGGTSKMEQ